MPLNVGTRIGAFEIVERIGAGGMGEVWRATDTKLGRDVAVKTLPPAFAHDRDRLARFEREARLLASLNHAHIASIYSLDEHEGSLFIAMEFVEGRTLEDELMRGALEVSRALELGLQIALALEAAHEKHVIHRDLKPANIMVMPDGVVKVLDFGLAKPVSGVVGETQDLTKHGALLGTDAYMSPEQVRGEPVGVQADIWAFGCVLYEMLCGQSAFRRASAAETLARVLERPPDIDLLPDACPKNIRLLIRRCLEKGQRRRLHHIADARIELEDTLAASSETAAEPGTVHRLGGRTLAGFAAGATVVGVGALVLAAFDPSEQAEFSPFRFSVRPPAPPNVLAAGANWIDLSADGARFAYVANRQIFEGAVNDSSAARMRVAGLSPFYRDDGRWLGFVDGLQIKKISLAGETVESITTYVPRFLGADWRGDRILFASGEGLYMVSDQPGSMPELLLESGEELTYAWPQFTDDFSAVLVSGIPVAGAAAARVYLYDLEDRSLTPVASGTVPQYLPEGIVVSAVGGVLQAQTVDIDTRMQIGTPVAVPGSAIAIGSFYGEANFRISATGTLMTFTVTGGNPSLLTPVWKDPDSGEEEATAVASAIMTNRPRLSPDGNRMAIDKSLMGDRDVFVLDLRDGTETNVSRALGEDLWPEWRGNSELCWSTRRWGGMQLACRRADGLGDTERLIETDVAVLPWHVDSEGRIFVFNGDTQQADLGLVSASEPRELSWLLADPAYSEINAGLSPDGRYLLYEAGASGGPTQIYVSPFPSLDKGRWQISPPSGGSRPRWGGEIDGMQLVYYVTPDGEMWRAKVEFAETASVRERRLIFSIGSTQSVFGGLDYDVSPQDGRLLFLREEPQDRQAEASIDFVLNWDSLLNDVLSQLGQ